MTGGFNRMIVWPFIDKAGQLMDPDFPNEDPIQYSQLTPEQRRERRNALYGFIPGNDEVEPPAPPSEFEQQASAAVDLKYAIQGTISEIDSYTLTQDVEPSVQAALDGYRAELIGLRTQPGTLSVINDETKRILTLVQAITDYKFRFEVDE